jgi:hypothetical protein
MKFSVEPCGELGKGLKAEAYIAKGTCYFQEPCFCFTDLYNTRDDRDRIDRVGPTDEVSSLVVRALIRYEKDPGRLERFEEGHHGGTRKIGAEVFPILKRIAEVYQKKLNFITRLYSVFKDNAFSHSLPLNIRYLDRYVYNYASYANHRCVSYNTHWIIDSATGTMKFFAVRDIAPGDWITIPYVGETHKIDTVRRRAILREKMDFECRCPDCLENVTPVLTIFGKVMTLEMLGKYAMAEFGYKDLERVLLQNREYITRDIIAAATFFEYFRVILTNAVDESVPLRKSIQWKKLSTEAAAVFTTACQLLSSCYDPWETNESGSILAANLGCLVLTENAVPATFAVLKFIYTRTQVFGINEQQTFNLVLHNFLGVGDVLAKTFGFK